MLDFLLLLAFVVLPVVMWTLTRSLTWVGTRVAFAFGLAGTAVQTTVTLGWAWNLLRLQLLVLVVMAVLTTLAVRARPPGNVRLTRQFVVIVVPMVTIGAFLIGMRLLAPGAPGPLTGVGYFINHPLAEDNAKWLNLSSQLASGRDLVFNGYAGGPLILVMVVMATLVSVLSMLLLGGVNEVAVAVNAVIGTQFLLITLIPIALAPFAEGRVPRAPRTGPAVARALPAPLVWVAMVVVLVASAVVTSYGHLSLQFVLIILVLWACVFLVGTSVPRARLLMTLTIATTASVWLPLNVLGLALLAGCAAAVLWRRDWWGLAIVLATTAAVWDALISSTLYLLGWDVPVLGGGGGGGGDTASGGATEPAVSAVASNPLAAASSLFEAPGGTEIVQPLLAALAIASLLAVVAFYSRTRPVTGLRSAVPFAPIIVMAAYLLCITIGDVVITGGSPHYGVHKMAFAVTIMLIGVTLPIGLASLEPRATGMTLLRWFAVGSVVLLLSVDTILPRGLSALSPVLWPTVDPANPVYWSAAEVRRTGDQPIDSLPIACLFAPPASSVPSALPSGQQSYNCTRLLVGLTGLEGRAGSVTGWLLNDWLSNTQTWNAVHGALASDPAGINDRTVVLTNTDGSLAGLTTMSQLLQRYPAAG